MSRHSTPDEPMSYAPSVSATLCLLLPKYFASLSVFEYTAKLVLAVDAVTSLKLFVTLRKAVSAKLFKVEALSSAAIIRSSNHATSRQHGQLLRFALV